MPIEEEPIETVKRGWRVVAPWDGVLVTVKKVREDGEFIVLEIGEAFCLEVRKERGSVVSVWRRRRRKERKEE